MYDCDCGEDAITVAMMGSDTPAMTASQGCGEPSTGTLVAEFCWCGEYSGRKPTSSAGDVIGDENGGRVCVVDRQTGGVA